MALSLAGVTYISSHLRQVSIPFFKHILKLCTLLLHVEGVGFVLRMRDASPSTNPSFKHDPCKALSVIRTILPAVAPIWLTRKSHVSIRYLIILVFILRLIPLAPPPPLPPPLLLRYGCKLGNYVFWFCLHYSCYGHANFSTRYELSWRKKKYIYIYIFF